MVKLRECGLVTARIDGKWHRYILRGFHGICCLLGGVTGNCNPEDEALRAIQIVQPSETRMSITQRNQTNHSPSDVSLGQLMAKTEHRN